MTDEAHLAKLLRLRARIDTEIRRLERRIAAATIAGRIPARRGTARCGTDGGYYRHIRTTFTPPCADCLAAHAAAEHVRRIQRRAAARIPDQRTA
jgi:hypothetical protein